MGCTLILYKYLILYVIIFFIFINIWIPNVFKNGINVTYYQKKIGMGHLIKLTAVKLLTPHILIKHGDFIHRVATLYYLWFVI